MELNTGAAVPTYASFKMTGWTYTAFPLQKSYNPPFVRILLLSDIHSNLEALPRRRMPILDPHQPPTQ